MEGRSSVDDLQVCGFVMAMFDPGRADVPKEPSGAEHLMVPAGAEGGRSEGGGVRTTS